MSSSNIPDLFDDIIIAVSKGDQGVELDEIEHTGQKQEIPEDGEEQEDFQEIEDIHNHALDEEGEEDDEAYDFRNNIVTAVSSHGNASASLRTTNININSSSSSSNNNNRRNNNRSRVQMEDEVDDYDDGENMNRHEHKIKRNKNQHNNEEQLDDIEEAMEMGVGELAQEDEYESVPIIELNWTRAIARERQHEADLIRENKPNTAGLKPDAYDPDFNFLSFAVETKSQETSFPLFKKMFTFFSKAEETSDYVDLCMQIQDYYNERIRPVSSIGNKCWPVKKIWEYFHITCPSIKHNLEFELRSLNRLFDTVSNCVLKRNKNTGKTDQIDIKCIKLKFQIMEHRSKLMREVYNMRFNQISEESKKPQ
jgi:hypothetical protein